MKKQWKTCRNFLCAGMAVLMLAFVLAGCGTKEAKETFVPSDQLPEGVLEYTVPAFNDEVEFAAVFVSAAISMRLEADRYNALVCRFDAENGDPDKLEQLLEKTRDAYEAADKMAAMALDVSVALAELEKSPDYSPFKPLQGEKKAALLDRVFSTAYAKAPHVMWTKKSITVGNNDTRIIEYLSNGTWRFQGETGVKGQLWDENRYNAWKKEEQQESEAEAKAREQAAKDRAAARKKAEEEAAALEKKMAEDARAKQEALQAQVKADNSGERPARTADTEAIVAKYGYNEILEVYNKFKPGQNLRGLAKYLKIEGRTNYETYQKALDVYKRAKEYAELRGVTVTQADEASFQNNNYKVSYTTVAAGKCAEAGLSWIDPRNAIDKSHAAVKTAEALTWVTQTGFVVATGDENETVKKWQNTTENLSLVTGGMQLGNKLVTGQAWNSLKNAYDLYKQGGIVEAAKQVVTLKNVYDLYGDGKTVYDIYQKVKDAKTYNDKLKNAPDNSITAQSQRVNEDGSITVRTTLTSSDDPDKDKKLTAVTGLTGDELAKAEEKATALPEEPSVEEEEKELSEADQEKAEIIEWMRSLDFQLVVNLAEDMRQPFAADKVVGIYHTNKSFAEGATGSYTIRVHKIDENNLSLFYSVYAAAGGMSETMEDSMSVPYDPATGQILDGNGMHFVDTGGSICLSAGELGLIPRQ